MDVCPLPGCKVAFTLSVTEKPWFPPFSTKVDNLPLLFPLFGEFSLLPPRQVAAAHSLSELLGSVSLTASVRSHVYGPNFWLLPLVVLLLKLLEQSMKDCDSKLITGYTVCLIMQILYPGDGSGYFVDHF